LDFALLTDIAQRGGHEPITDQDDLARLPEGPAKLPWYDQRVSSNYKLAAAQHLGSGQGKSPKTEKLRMPNLHLTKEQIPPSPRSSWAAKENPFRQLPIPPAGLPPRHSRRLVGRQEIYCMAATSLFPARRLR